MRAHGEYLSVNCKGNGETAYDAVFAMASLSLGQDRYDFLYRQGPLEHFCADYVNVPASRLDA